MIFTIALLVMFLVEGIYEIVVGRPVGASKDYNKKYEPKSYAVFCRLCGVATLIIAAGFFLLRIKSFNIGENFPTYVGFIVIGVAAAFILISFFLIPKKINQGTAPVNSNNNSSSDNEEYIDED